MGWSKGKGLGKNEDGIKENIKVRVKTNNAGLCCWYILVWPFLMHFVFSSKYPCFG